MMHPLRHYQQQWHKNATLYRSFYRIIQSLVGIILSGYRACHMRAQANCQFAISLGAF